MHTTVIMVGDSITEGVGASDPARTSYVAVLGELLGDGYTVLNFGRCGATVMDPPNGQEDSYLRLSHYTRAKQAAGDAAARGDRVIVSVLLGTNDADVIDYGFEVAGERYYETYHDAFIAGTLSIVESFREICPTAIFLYCKSPWSYDDRKHRRFGNLPSVWRYQQEIFERMAASGYRVTLLDVAAHTAPEVLGNSVSEYFDDGLHPSDRGYKKMAAFFWETIRTL